MNTSRITTLDAVRGLAVMGILLLNITDFGLPGYAYVDPNYYGGADGANWWTWAITYVLFDGKMRGLFTMMFGASTVLIAGAALAKGESPARVHYVRMISLFTIGMVHAYLIWSGDILVLYSVCGAIAFFVWRTRPRVLLATGIALLAWKFGLGMIDYVQVARVERVAMSRTATSAQLKAWADVKDDLAPSPETAVDDLKAYRGSWADAHRARIASAREVQLEIDPIMLPDTLALMAIGMALFRLGFFSGEWSRAAYRRTALLGLAALPFYIPLVMWIQATRFSPVTLLAAEAIHLSLLRPFVSLAWASAIILFMQSGAMTWLATRLAAAGRMAFSNYLGTSIVCTLIFNGYGLGWFGYFSRWQLYIVVALVWTLILLWSKPWLTRFRYGPLEWVWRSLARLRLQPMRKA